MPVIASTPSKTFTDAIEISEASMKLEGFDTTKDPLYRDLRDRVLAGEIDFDQAVKSAVHSLSPVSRRSAA